MENLSKINDISDKSFNELLNRLSIKSKRFMSMVRKEIREKGIDLTTKVLKQSLISFKDFENTNDTLLVFLKENEDQYGEDVSRWLNELSLQFFYYTAFAQTRIKNKAFKREYFEALYKTIESVLIQSGESFRSTEYAQKVEQQLLDLIYTNLTPDRVLQPRENISVDFFKDMFMKLAEEGFISQNFKDEQTQIDWIYSAFNFEFHNKNQFEKKSLKIDWHKLTDLADWLLFLKESCVIYEYKEKTLLFDWVIKHVSINNKKFVKHSKSYDSLERTYRERKKMIGEFFTIDENKRFDIRKGSPPPWRSFK
jgi:hypothetical protein